MSQTTTDAGPVPEGQFRFWHYVVTVPYFVIMVPMFGEMIRTFSLMAFGQNRSDLELVISPVIALFCAYVIVRFIAVTSHRKSQERLGVIQQTLYYITVGLGWFGIAAIPASLVGAMLLFVGAKSSPGHPPTSAAQPAVEAR